MCAFFPPPPTAECFTPAGLSSVLVNKMSILCMWRRDQYSPRQQVNRVEKLLKPTRGWSRKAESRRGTENRAAPFRRSSSEHQSSSNKNKWDSDLVPLLSGCRLPFPEKKSTTTTKKPRVHFCVSHDFRPI